MADDDDFQVQGALPTLIVIGAMKAATSALHRYLDSHPEVSMSRQKELNFFNGPATSPGGDPSRWWLAGQWHRGLSWYRRQFDASFPVRGESSPAYTSPSFPEVTERMASLLPGVRLLYLVREPFARALSQYAHHLRDGSENRPPDVALMDPHSQYLGRSRYVERLRPFLERFRAEQVHVVVQERLDQAPLEELRRVATHVGVEPGPMRAATIDNEPRSHQRPPDTPTSLGTRFRQAVADDAEQLRVLLDDPVPEWPPA